MINRAQVLIASLIKPAAFVIAGFVLTVNMQAQTGGGGGNGGGTGGGDGGGAGGGTGGGTIDIPGGQTPTGNDGGGTGGVSDIPEFQIETIMPEIEDERVQPFVGPSTENITHPFSQIGGGGAAGGGGGRTTFSFGGGGGGGGFGQGGVGAAGSEFGFTAPRRSLRAALRNRIVVPNVETRDIDTANRFQQRMVRLPSTQNIGQVNVTVVNRGAVLTGTVATLAEKQHVERMARLEPGIYSIDNQINVLSTGGN